MCVDGSGPGPAGSPTVLAGHSPPPERLGPQHRLSQAGEFGGGERRATTMRGRLWARFEGVQGRQAKLGQVWSLAVLAGHFPPPYSVDMLIDEDCAL